MKNLVTAAITLLSAVLLSACPSEKAKDWTWMLASQQEFTVGGTVSGLTGSGLALQNNGGDDLEISSSGTFTFPAKVPDGSAYLVTVKTQPAAQTCTANRNAGTINGANIANVSIICSANAYTVGGIVSGLTGSGLVLRNNSLDDLAISGNGSFTFATEVADGAAYHVTVKTQPTAPSQACTVTNGSGTILGANVTNVAVNCTVKTWHHPASLSDYINPNPDANGAQDPQVAMDNKGNAIIVWAQNDGNSNLQIFKSEYRNGGWVNPSGLSDNISPDGPNGTFRPRVAMDDNGNAIIAWSQYDGTGFQIFKSEFRNGTWHNPANLSDFISPDSQYEPAQDPQVAMDNNGNAVIVWKQTFIGEKNWAWDAIFKSVYRNSVWTNPTGTADYLSAKGRFADQPQVAMDDNGNAIIVWTEGNSFVGEVNQIFKSEYRNGVWTYPTGTTDNLSPDGQGAYIPQVAMDNNGNAIVVWEQSDGTNRHIFKSEYRNGSWHNPASLFDNISPNGQDASYAQVAMDNNGNAIIVWQQSDGNHQRIFKSEYRGGNWTNPASLSDNISPDGQLTAWPQVAMDDNGNAIIVWEESDGSHLQIFKSEYRNGAWTTPAGLSDNVSPDGCDARGPRVAMDNNGNAIIVWYEFNLTHTWIFKSEYR